MTTTTYETTAACIRRLEDELGRLHAINAELEQALRDIIAAFVNPGDGGPFEDGEVPVLDRARAIAPKTDAGEREAEIERLRGSKVTTWTAADRAEVARRAVSGGEDRG